MIRRFLGRVFSGKLFKSAQPKVIPFKTHRIASDHVSRCALKTCELLQQRGHPAYVVGGAVRDLLLGGIAQGLRRRHRRDARGGARDFPPLAHHRPALPARARDVRRGDDRGVHVSRRGRRRATDAGDHATDEHGRILRDNVFGTHGRRRARAATSPSMRCFTTRARRGHRLSRRRRRHQSNEAAHDRRSRAALSRGPGTHAARGAARGGARPRNRNAHA